MKHRTPSWQRNFYKEVPEETKKKLEVPLEESLVSGGKIVSITEDEAKLVPSNKERKCRHCGDITSKNSYFYCKKHKPKDEDDNGDYVYVGSSHE